jgi:Dolichyl-phosphate-mannose-protein mannosyltransferase
MGLGYALRSLVANACRSKATVRTIAGVGLAGPTFLVLLIALFQLAVWGGLAGAVAAAPPDDSLEQLLLSQELRPEYGKHPPLPTWILFTFNRIFGASIGATYVLGALCSVGTMLLLYAFARPLIGARRAALAAILLSNVEYMNAGTAYFNHNTVQMPLALLAIVLFHRALTLMRWRDWALFGLGCGVMMLVKFSAVVLFASFAVYLLWARRLAEPCVWKGLAIAALAGVAVFAPYCIFIRNDAWSPNAYAVQSVFPGDVDRIASLKTVWGFTSSQLAKVAPALLIFSLLRRGATRVNKAQGGAVALGPFLTLVGFGPIVLTVVIASLSGAQLLVGWGTTFHVLLTFWLVAASPLAIDATPQTVRKAAAASVVVQCLLWALVTTHDGRLPNLNPTPRTPPAPTPAQLADAVRSTWAEHCVAPLRFVATDGHTGAALAVRYQGQPRVVDATRAEFGKFFSDDARSADGAVVVVRRPSGASATRSTQRPIDHLLADSTWRTNVDLPASDGRHYEYLLGVLAPLTGEGCEYSTKAARNGPGVLPRLSGSGVSG